MDNLFNYKNCKKDGYDFAKKFFLSDITDEKQRKKSIAKLKKIESECGPVIDSYPMWHPFLITSFVSDYEFNNLNRLFGRLDHTIYFVNGILTAPYHPDFESFNRNVECLNEILRKRFYKGYCPVRISVEELNEQFWSPSAKPILIKCNWSSEYDEDLDIRQKYINGKNAIALLLKSVCDAIAFFNDHKFEHWENMRSEILGQPNGNFSSMFVSEETGISMKEIWDILTKEHNFDVLDR